MRRNAAIGGIESLFSMRRQVFNNIFFSYANFFVSIAAPLILVPLLVRLLGKDLYGQWLVILSLTSYLTIANLGLGRTLANEFAIANAHEDRGEVGVLLSTSFITYSVVVWVMMAVLIAKLPTISARFLGGAGRNVIAALIVTGVGAAFELPFGVYAMLLRGFKRVDQEQGVIAFATVARVAAVAVALIAGFKIIALAIIQSVSRVLSALAYYFYVEHYTSEARPRLSRFSSHMLRRLLLPSAGFLAIYIAQTINTGLDNLVIAAFRPPAEVTQYAVALRLVFVNTGIFAVMTETLAPYVTADFTLQRNERLRTGYILFLKLGFLYGVSATIGLWFLGPAVIRAWAGPGIFPGKLTFGLQVIYLLTNVLANPAYTVLTATMRHYGLTVVAVIECVINLTLSIWLVQRWGIAGVIAGSVFAHLLTNAWYMQYAALQILDIPISQVLNELAPAALLSVIALGAALIVEPFKALPMFAGTAVISTIVALPVFVTAFALVVFNADERNQAWFALARFIQSRGREGLAG